MTRETQKAQVKRHLLLYGSITPLQALDNYGCFRLASVINRLRNEGWKITTIMAIGEEINYARYTTKETFDNLV